MIVFFNPSCLSWVVRGLGERRDEVSFILSQGFTLILEETSLKILPVRLLVSIYVVVTLTDTSVVSSTYFTGNRLWPQQGVKSKKEGNKEHYPGSLFFDPYIEEPYLWSKGSEETAELRFVILNSPLSHTHRTLVGNSLSTGNGGTRENCEPHVHTIVVILLTNIKINRVVIKSYNWPERVWSLSRVNGSYVKGQDMN